MIQIYPNPCKNKPRDSPCLRAAMQNRQGLCQSLLEPEPQTGRAGRAQSESLAGHDDDDTTVTTMDDDEEGDEDDEDDEDDYEDEDAYESWWWWRWWQV